MANVFNGMDSGTKNFSVETVRNILNLDNKGIAKLCAQVSLMPKKDRHGRTYFSSDDVDILRRIRGLHTQSTTRSKVTNPVKPVSKVVKEITAAPVKQPSLGVQKIVSSISKMENNITDKISKLLDEKLEGMDEVIVELVRSKTENETLRYKLNELNKENYNLKNEVSRYKEVGFGFYIKKSGDSIL